MITYEKYAEIRDKKNLTDGKVAELAGFGRSTFSDWKSGRSTPKPDKMVKIADVLGMSYAQFVGPVGKFSAYKEKPHIHLDVDLTPILEMSPRLLGYVHKFLKLSSESQEEVINYIEYMESKEKKGNDS